MIRLAAAVLIGLVAGGSPIRAQENANLRFRSVDVIIDSADNPLAAYQLTFSAADSNVKIVGIEGGAHHAFRQPPFYDPEAMQRNHVIIAAFNTGPAAELPSGRVRVATIHVQVEGDHPTDYRAQLTTAARADRKRIAATVHVQERKD